MYLYSDFCHETVDDKGILQDFSLDYPENYNFGYDVVDEMARLMAGESGQEIIMPHKLIRMEYKDVIS